MATPTSHKKNSSAVKRIMSEARELTEDESTEYSAGPLESDIFEWHCTIRGPADTEFEGGLYHCRIILPPEYPFKAPSIMILTPNGRFELNKKICISFTSYHEELWQPAWGVRTAIIGLQGFFPLKGEAAVGVGAVEYPISERKRLATLSRSWTCPDCGQPNLELLPDPPAKETSSSSSTTSEPAPTAPETAVAPSHPSIAEASIPGSIPPLFSTEPKTTTTTATAPSPLQDIGAPADFMNPVPAVVTGPIIPVSTVPTTSEPVRAPTPPALKEALEAAKNRAAHASGAATPSDSPPPPPVADDDQEDSMPTPRPRSLNLPPQPPQPQQQQQQDVAVPTDRRGKPPMWLDGSIAFLCVLIAYVAGRRASYLWELVTDH